MNSYPSLPSLDTLTTSVIKEVNRYVGEEFRIYGKTLQVIKDSMNTADFTKLFQYIVNEVIESEMKKLGIDGKREEVTGYDYIIDGYKFEFKLMGGNDKSSFATGNKTSHFGGAKTNLVWSIKYTFNDNQIDSFAMTLIDTNLVESNVWKSSSGRKDSFSTLKLTNDESDAVVYSMGLVKKSTKYLQLIPLPTDILV